MLTALVSGIKSEKNSSKYLNSVVSRLVFWRDRTNRDSVRKTETGRGGIRDNAKLNSQLKIVKKSLDNATKAPKIEIHFQFFFSFLTFAGSFSHIIHRFKDFRPFRLNPYREIKGRTRKSGRDEKGRVSRQDTRLE